MLHSKNGSAIIIVLIISIIAMSLTLFAVSVSKKMINSSEMLIDKLYAKFGAESEIEKLKFFVSTGRFYPAYIKNSAEVPGFPKTLYIDGRKQKIDNATLYIQGTGGLINVWLLNKNLISSLLRIEGVESDKIETICSSLEDWYDKDNVRRIDGAESEYYKLRGFHYTPRNFSGVQSIYEWHAVRGLIDNKTFNVIKKYLVLSTNYYINIDAMDATMLSAVFNIPLSMADTIINIRDTKGTLSLSDIKRVTGKDVDSLSYGSYPTFVLDIDTNFKFNVSMEKISCTISFKPDNATPYRVLEWQN